MSLLDDASLIVTPNGYKASKLYSVKPTDASGDMTVSRATTATRVNSSNLIESVAINVPRLDYTLGSCPSILVEPARTNLIIRSQEFDNASWTMTNVTITANTTTSPSNTLTADTITANGTTNTHSLRTELISFTAGTSYSLSVFAKKGNNDFLQLFVGAGIGGMYANFNINTGVVGETGVTSVLATDPTASITNFGNGWYRCTMNFTALFTDASIGRFAIVSSAIAGRDEINDLSTSVILWGAQCEAGSNASSYIPTTTATVTRNADVISKTGVSSLIGQTEGTIYAEIKVTKLLGVASRYVFHLSDGTANNRIYIAFSGADSNVLRARIFSGGTLQCSINSSALTSTGTYKLAMAYKNNDIVFYINGIQIGTDTSATIPTCSKVDLGHNQVGASQFNDGINNANIWKTRLTNAQLATLTTL